MLSDEDLNLAASYSLGMLDDADLRRVEARLAAGDTGLRRAITEFSEATSPMADRPAPSTDLRERLVAAAGADHGEPLTTRAVHAAPARPAVDAAAAAPASAGSAAPPAAPTTKVVAIARHRGLVERLAPVSAATAATLLVLSAVLLVQWIGLRGRVSELDSQKHGLEGQLVHEHERGRWLEVWSSPVARIAEFGPGPQAIAQFGGRAVYDPATQRAVVVFDHVAVPRGHVLQLWANRPDGPANLGLVQATLDGRAEMRIESVGDPGSLTGFVVSVEPAGVSAQDSPSGPIVLVARLAD